MQNFTSFLQDIYHFRFNSPLARRVLKHIFSDGKNYTVHLGPLRGIKLKYEQTINFHAMLGLWELSSFKLLSKVLKHPRFQKDAGVIWDIGANIGLYSAWFSKQFPNFQIHSFEPAPFARGRLTDTVSINQFRNITIHSFAFSDKIGEVEFFIGAHHHQSSLNETWAGDGQIKPERIVVPTRTLDSFYEEKGREKAPLLIKMDIEGGGVFALKSCEKLLRESSPYFWIESHSEEEDQAISNILTKYDYEAYRSQTQSWVMNKKETYPNKEGVWGDLFLCPSKDRAEISNLLNNK